MTESQTLGRNSQQFSSMPNGNSIPVNPESMMNNQISRNKRELTYKYYNNNQRPLRIHGPNSSSLFSSEQPNTTTVLIEDESESPGSKADSSKSNSESKEFKRMVRDINIQDYKFQLLKSRMILTAEIIIAIAVCVFCMERLISLQDDCPSTNVYTGILTTTIGLLFPSPLRNHIFNSNNLHTQFDINNNKSVNKSKRNQRKRNK